MIQKGCLFSFNKWFRINKLKKKRILAVSRMMVHQGDFQKTGTETCSENSQEEFVYPVEICKKIKAWCFCKYHQFFLKMFYNF